MPSPADARLLGWRGGGRTARVGYPASANAAVADVFNESIMAEMFRSFVRGEVSEDAAINNALDRIGPIFDKWRGEGLL